MVKADSICFNSNTIAISLTSIALFKPNNKFQSSKDIVHGKPEVLEAGFFTHLVLILFIVTFILAIKTIGITVDNISISPF